MRWLQRLLRDDEGADKLEDGYPANTFIEIYLIGLIGVVGLLCFLIALSMVASWMGWF